MRLWISSLTDKAIREGLRKLEDGSKYDNLYLAAKARSESDWLVGINGTQALSIAAGHGTYSVGRVQTPTLAMVCERYWENRRFTSEAFWQLHIATDGCDGEVVENEFADEVPEEKREAFVLKLLPLVGNVFSVYDLSDDNFALSSDYDLLYTELTGATVLYLDEYGV